MSAGGEHGGGEPKKGEEQAPPSERSSRGKAAAAAAVKQHWCIGLRALELVVVIFAIGLIVDPISSGRIHVINNLHHVSLIFSTYGGFLIISAVLVFARVMGEPVGWRTSLAFSLVGAVMFTATAAVIFYVWQTSLPHNSQYRPTRYLIDMICASGVFAVFNAALYLLHAGLTIKKEANY